MKVDGRKVTDKIKVSPRVPEVGHYKKKKNVVLIDRKIPAKERRFIAVHEAAERYLRYGEGMPKMKAHRIAEREEGRYARKHGVSWVKYHRDVERVWRKNRRPGQRRRK